MLRTHPRRCARCATPRDGAPQRQCVRLGEIVRGHAEHRAETVCWGVTEPWGVDAQAPGRPSGRHGRLLVGCGCLAAWSGPWVMFWVLGCLRGRGLYFAPSIVAHVRHPTNTLGNAAWPGESPGGSPRPCCHEGHAMHTGYRLGWLIAGNILGVFIYMADGGAEHPHRLPGTLRARLRAVAAPPVIVRCHCSCYDCGI